MKLLINTTTAQNIVAMALNYMSKDGTYANRLTIELAKDNNLLIKATDYIEAIEVAIPYTSDDDVVFAPFSVDGKDFSTVLRAVKNDEFIMEIINENIIIKNGKTKVKIAMFAEPQEFEKPNQGSTIPLTDTIIESLRVTEHSIGGSQPHMRACFQGAYLQNLNGALKIVSTDTVRLTVQSCGDAPLDFKGVIIPRNAVKTIIKYFSSGYDLICTDTEIVISTENLYYSSKLINMEFADYTRLIAPSYQQKVTISAAKLTSLLKEASLFQNVVEIEIAEGILSVRDEEGNCETYDEIDDDNAKIKFTINSKFVLEYLSAVGKERVQLCFNGETIPVALISNPSVFEIMMPVTPDKRVESAA